MDKYQDIGSNFANRIDIKNMDPNLTNEIITKKMVHNLKRVKRLRK